jgi:phage baseplate assembly protein W|tara:strand:- start:7 stop:444 length:438 start_codon:yes stop_codon:yes gene_type:complete
MANVANKRPPGKSQLTYKDFDIGFRRHPATGKLLLKKNDDSIRQALKYLVLLNKYERPYSPELGTDLRNHLFENFDPFTADNLKVAIETAIKNFEPRVSINDTGEGQGVYVRQIEDDNALAVTIRYTNTNTSSVSDLNINLNRIR